LKKLRTSDLRKMKKKDLEDKLLDVKKEISNLNISAGRGTLKKDSGSLKSFRQNVARILTVLNEKRVEA